MLWYASICLKDTYNPLPNPYPNPYPNSSSQFQPVPS